MQININLTAEQTKALLTEYTSIEEYASRVVVNRANRIMEAIVKKYANNLEGVTVDEQAVIDAKLANKIIVQPDQLAEEVKKIIIKRAGVKTMVEKIAAQALELEPKVSTK